MLQPRVRAERLSADERDKLTRYKWLRQNQSHPEEINMLLALAQEEEEQTRVPLTLQRQAK